MTTEELEALLEAAVETQRLDFKQSCAWDVKTFAKDILAFANVLDGGHIIIGVAESDGRFHRQGISDDHAKTYELDQMRDQVEPFADPHVDFVFEIQSDRHGLKYGIITVRPFEETPVICKRTHGDLTAGTIYYRNRDKRISSGRCPIPTICAPSSR